MIKPPLDLSDKGSKETRGRHLLQQMEGAGGLGVERLFWDRREKKLVAIVWFGGSLCGWPGVTHGGAIATLLAEKISIAAALAENSGAQESALAAATPQRMPGTGNHAKMFAPVAVPAEPAQLSLSYVKPTYANKFYVIRVAPAIAADESAREVEGPGKPGQVSALAGGSEWEARVETMAATNCVLSRAKFAPGTGVQGLVEKVDSGVGTGYREFKEWMWPSRQASTSGLS